jgi:glutathione synthase/RimK-type ligase-like ATP-grasp enzyme
MKKCAFLSMDSLENFFAYDDMVFAPLKAQGWHAEHVSWRKQDVNWSQYDVVVIRSTWDYQSDAPAFLACLEAIEASSAQLENPLALVKWNISKDYLRDMQQQGINIVPTLWFDSFDLPEVEQGFQHFSSEQLVIKPLISANADHTYRLTPQSLLNMHAQLAKEFGQRPFMLQPFLPAIVEEGEYSLFYFAGHYSHSILKRPKGGDFRVQEEHGGLLQSIQPCEEMLTCARHALASLPAEALYARIDLIRHQGEFALMEIELIEPSLYFNMDTQSAQRFADAFVETFGQG